MFSSHFILKIPETCPPPPVRVSAVLGTLAVWIPNPSYSRSSPVLTVFGFACLCRHTALLMRTWGQYNQREIFTAGSTSRLGN